MFGTVVIVQFKEPEYSVMEEGTQLSLGVQIIGENEIPLTVPFTIRGSATREDNNHYLALSRISKSTIRNFCTDIKLLL